ncbi:sodium/glutamate symporter [Maridesulfovibrio hydrothermalis]|uniref:Sodium/glutamate symporter n=1 Tax=Maridesulfovibrio hydrothermalis AM13 = DSM 14728 TaxID=1121451 RepID=L0RCE6_9BACT|nr:sodium/glutamate symporter [Maridesulfovibrio hydrothermalis]CCO24438.1 Sodium/glutamate symport carrier protein [Maridesulfovibrio hydrothermalis AM13 = DSM 14728]
MIFEVDGFQSFSFGILVFLAGWGVNRKVEFLRKFTIPEPVTGGLLAAAILTIGYVAAGVEIKFDLVARDALILYFFTCIGLNANFRKLLKGGKSLFLLLAAAMAFLVAQNLVGIGVAKLIGLERVIGLIGGSISLIGGHGTAIAWAPILSNQFGVTNAMEIGAACATFGLVLASVMGGPVANHLIVKHNLRSTDSGALDVGTERSAGGGWVNHVEFLSALLLIHVTMIIGVFLSDFLEQAGVMLPTFVVCLFTGIILTNTIPVVFKKVKWPAETVSNGLIAEISLGVFLAMSLMSVQLWELVDLAAPLLILLSVQFMLSFLFIIYVVFNVMGRDYEAAVMVAGFGGFSMGATPTAIANMTAVTEKHGPAHIAFIVIPLVCSFFIDLFNAFVIKLLL